MFEYYTLHTFTILVAESEQPWSGVGDLTGELQTVPLNSLGVEMQQDYHIG